MDIHFTLAHCAFIVEEYFKMRFYQSVECKFKKKFLDMFAYINSQNYIWSMKNLRVFKEMPLQLLKLGVQWAIWPLCVIGPLFSSE